MIFSVGTTVFPSNGRIISAEKMLLAVLVSVYILNVHRIKSGLFKGLLRSICRGDKLAIQINLVSEYLIISAITRQLYKFIGIFLEGTFKTRTAHLCRYRVMITRTIGNYDIIIAIIQLYGGEVQFICGINANQRKI